MKKTCKICGEEKDIIHFYSQYIPKSKKRYWRGDCKSCHNKNYKESDVKSPPNWVPPNHKFCKECETVKPTTDFPVMINDGLFYFKKKCRKCSSTSDNEGGRFRRRSNYRTGLFYKLLVDIEKREAAIKEANYFTWKKLTQRGFHIWELYLIVHYHVEIWGADLTDKENLMDLNQMWSDLVHLYKTKV